MTPDNLCHHDMTNCRTIKQGMVFAPTLKYMIMHTFRVV